MFHSFREGDIPDTEVKYQEGFTSGIRAGRKDGISLAQKLITLSSEVPHELKIKLWEYLEALKTRD